MTSTRWLAGVGVAIALLVVVALVLTSVTGHEAVYPEGSPERTVRAYLHAVSERDAGAATALLTPDLAERSDTTYKDPIVNRTSSLRATLDRATTRDDTAEVHVQITETYGAGPFGANESNQAVVFTLARSGGTWRISESPWPLYCPQPAPLAPAGPR
jgi:hypothetical protein